MVWAKPFRQCRRLWQIFEGIGFIGIAVREGNLHQIVTHFLLVDGFLIEDRVDHLTGLLKNAVRNFIAPARFIHKAQSELIHVGRILRTAGNGGFEFAVFRIAVRMDLNPLHAFERCAGLDGSFKHFARRAGWFEVAITEMLLYFFTIWRLAP